MIMVISNWNDRSWYPHDCQMVIGSFTTKNDTSMLGALHCAKREKNGNGFYYPISTDVLHYWLDFLVFVSCCH